jgi:hypothetical protein
LGIKKPRTSVKNVNVKFDEQLEEEKDNQVNHNSISISKENTDIICKKLAIQFVEAKKAKLSYCVSIYNWLNNTFTLKIMLKNDKKELEELRRSHANGEIVTPTELEKLMLSESEQIIRMYYDNKKGSQELALLLKSEKEKKTNQSLLETT